MTPAGIEPATFRFVAQHLNHCASAGTAVTYIYIVLPNILRVNKIIKHLAGNIRNYFAVPRLTARGRCEKDGVVSIHRVYFFRLSIVLTKLP